MKVATMTKNGQQNMSDNMQELITKAGTVRIYQRDAKLHKYENDESYQLDATIMIYYHK